MLNIIKKLSCALLISFCHLVYTQNDYTIHKSSTTDVKELQINTFYDIDKTLFENYKCHEEKSKLIYTFEVWCKSCLKTLPKLLSFYEKNQKYLDLFIIISDSDKYWLKRTVKYFNKKGYPNVPIFVLIDSKNKKNPWFAYEKFVKSLFPDHKEFGYSLMMLFDNNNNPLYATTYNQTSEEKIEGIKTHLNLTNEE